MSGINIIQSKFLRDRFYEQLMVVKPTITKLNDFLNVHEIPIPMFSTREEIVNREFDSHAKLLTNKDIVKSITELVDRYYRWVAHNPKIAKKITGRIFVSAWTIASFPEFVLDKTPEQVKESEEYILSVYNSAANFVNTVNDIIVNPCAENYIKFISHLNGYSNAFSYFLQKDKIVKINDLAMQWYGLGKNIDLINQSKKYDAQQKIDTSEEIQNMRDTIEKYIKQLAPEFDLNELKKFEQLTDNMNSTMMSAYKDMLYEDISTHKYEVTRKVMEEIKTAFVVLNGGLKTQLDEYFDTEYLISRHSNGVLNFDNIYELGNYLVNIVHSLESPAGEPETSQRWKVICDHGYLDKNALITDMFMFILDELEDIKQNIINIQTLISLGINPTIV